MSSESSQALLSYARNSPEQLFTDFNSSVSGLTTPIANEQLKRYGINQVARKKPAPWWLQLLKTFNSPFNYLLLLLGLVSFISGNAASATLIAVMVLLSALLRFAQEFRSSKAAEELRSLISNQISVYRDDKLVDLSIENLVPGDIIQLSAGDLIPADIRLLEAKGLHVNQSALSGESFPVAKNNRLDIEMSAEPLACANLCFMGTSVVSGTGKAIVLFTGDQTYFGNLATKIIADEPPTDFEKGINALSWLLIRFILGMVTIILLINGLSKGDWLLSFLFALSVGVGLTPELLPMIITTNLSRGAIVLSKKKVIVKRLSAIQNLGAIDILCTDKTGTLTQNKVIVYQHLDLHGQMSLEVLKYAYLNSHFQTGLKNLLDEAILEHAEQDDGLRIAANYQKLDEIPFDFERRRLSVIIREGENPVLICKGAVEETLAVCNRIQDKGHEYPMTPEIMAKVVEQAQSLNRQGFRVVAIAYKQAPEHQAQFSSCDESSLILLGYIAFLDPPKETTAAAVKSLAELGVSLKILTGDNELVTQKICQTVELPVSGLLLGSEIDRLSDEELSQKALSVTIFAKLTPEHKQRIIRALRQSEHVIGFLGDGINDSPALKEADVGLSVNNAVDIAKESADMILLEQNLLVLRDGIIEGRKVFGNLIKYIRMSTSSNFGNVFSMVGASLLLPFLPMLPIQILTQNLLYDFSQTTIPFDTVDDEYLTSPHSWKIAKIERFMLAFGPVSSLFDYLLFGVMWFIFGANTVANQALFHTGWFVEGLLSQLLIVHLIRTRKIPFIESIAAPQLLGMTLIIMAIGVILPFSPLARFFGFIALPASYFIWLFGLLCGYFLLTQLVKIWYIRKFGYD